MSLPQEAAPLFCYFGHHKCGTGWINDIASSVCGVLEKDISSIRHIEGPESNFRIWVQSNKPDFVSYINADFKYVSLLENYRAFHIIRDPRDIVVSGYFSHLHSHSTEDWADLEPHRKALQGVTKEQGLFQEMDFSAKNIQRLGTWDYSLPNIFEVRLEELFDNQYQTFLNMFDFLGILDEGEASYNYPRIKGELLLAIVYRYRFSSYTKGRKRGEEDVSSHRRKAIAGDWKNHFSSDHKAYFKDKFPNLVPTLGYEKDDNW